MRLDNRKRSPDSVASRSDMIQKPRQAVALEMETLNPDSSANEQLTRYLLGEMSEAEQTQIEVRYFADPQLLAELCAWRNRLIDDYVCGGLSPSMRQRFET